MTTAILNLHRVQKNIHSRIDAISLPSVNWKSICFIGFFVGFILLVFYVWQINQLTQGFYTINSYEKQISQLSDTNKNLQISFAENSFLGQALEKIKALNFQKTASVEYIQILDNAAQIAKENKNL